MSGGRLDYPKSHGVFRQMGCVTWRIEIKKTASNSIKPCVWMIYFNKFFIPYKNPTSCQQRINNKIKGKRRFLPQFSALNQCQVFSTFTESLSYSYLALISLFHCFSISPTLCRHTHGSVYMFPTLLNKQNNDWSRRVSCLADNWHLLDHANRLTFVKLYPAWHVHRTKHCVLLQLLKKDGACVLCACHI